MEQNRTQCDFAGADSWVILTEIEQSIKRKIEAIGTPLKDWDIQINYGIKTGFNDAFIISTEKRNEILANCKSEEERRGTEELIRPILRGRDIKRYGYDWAGLWLIATFPSRHYDIEDYPAVKEHLLSFGMQRLEQTGKSYNIGGATIKARKKTNNKWFETQDSISYWEDFAQPKLVYNDIAQELSFALADDGIFLNNTAYFIGSKNVELLQYFQHILNSKLMDWYYRTISVQLGEKAVRMFSIYVLKIPIPFPERIVKEMSDIYYLYGLDDIEISYIESY